MGSQYRIHHHRDVHTDSGECAYRIPTYSTSCIMWSKDFLRQVRQVGDYVSTFSQCGDNKRKAEEHFPEMFRVLHMYLCDSLPQISYSYQEQGLCLLLQLNVYTICAMVLTLLQGTLLRRHGCLIVLDLDLCKLKNIIKTQIS